MFAGKAANTFNSGALPQVKSRRPTLIWPQATKLTPLILMACQACAASQLQDPVPPHAQANSAVDRPSTTAGPKGPPPRAAQGFARQVLSGSLQDRLSVADRAARAGQVEFALELYKSCVGGVGAERRLFGIWASELPPQLLWLAARNAPTMDYVEELLASTTRRLLTTPTPTEKAELFGEYDALVLLVELNRGLGREARTRELFHGLEAIDSDGWRCKTLASLAF